MGSCGKSARPNLDRLRRRSRIDDMVMRRLRRKLRPLFGTSRKDGSRVSRLAKGRRSKVSTGPRLTRKLGTKRSRTLRNIEIYALAALSLLTNEDRYEKAFLVQETATMNRDSRLWWSSLAGPALYLASPVGKKDPLLVERFTQVVLGTADAELASADKRALRWAGDWGMPMLIGQQGPRRGSKPLPSRA